METPHWDDYKERWKENFLHFPWGRDNYQEFMASILLYSMIGWVWRIFTQD